MLKIHLCHVVNNFDFHVKATPTALLCIFQNGGVFAVSCGGLWVFHLEAAGSVSVAFRCARLTNSFLGEECSVHVTQLQNWSGKIWLNTSAWKSASSSKSQLSAGKNWAHWNFFWENFCGMCVHAQGCVCDPILAWCKEYVFDGEGMAFPLRGKAGLVWTWICRSIGDFFFLTDKALQLKEEAIKQMVFRCFGVFLSHLHF